MFCSNCGTKNDDGTRFCMECGMPLNVPQAEDAAQAAPQQPQYQVPQYQAPQYQQPQYQPQYQQAAPVRGGNSFMTYELPENSLVKLPFQPFILKFIRLGIWSFMFFAIFFSWLSVSVLGYHAGSVNLISTAFGAGELGMGFCGFIAIITLLTILADIALNVIGIFKADFKLPIPKIVISAAPAVMTFLYIIVVAATGKGMAHAGFGAWFTLFLTLSDTAAYVLFCWDKGTSLFKA